MFRQCEYDLKNGEIQYIDKRIIEDDLDFVPDDHINGDREKHEYSYKIYKKKIEPMYIDKENSFMIGDKVLDVNAGLLYGVKSFLVESGEGVEEKKLIKKVNGELNKDFFIEKNLFEAIKQIL